MDDPIIEIGGEEIVPAADRANRIRRKRILRRRIAVAVVVAVLVSLSGWVGVGFWREEQRRDVAAAEHQRRICPGIGDTTGPGFALSMIGGECIGWIGEQDYPFAPEIQDISGKITAQNRLVSRRWNAPENGTNPVPYVRVAVLMPMTADDTSAMSFETIRNSLEGIYTAQSRANDLQRSDFRSPNTLGIQVLLVNEGKSATHWRTVVDQLAAMTGGEHPLVAVVGMGISIPETRDAAAELGARGIPSIGAVITATDMVADRFFKVSPPNVEYARSLAAYLPPGAEAGTGYLVHDINDDNYTRTLREAFEQQFGERFLLNQRRTSFAGTKKPVEATPGLFSRAVDNICATQADLVFYAGRERDLPALINALSTRGRCGHDKPITIATGATGLGRTQGDPVVLRQLTDARIAVVDASSTSPLEWAQGRQAPPDYRAFHDYFRDGLRFPAESLIDGYAIMHHDALATAIWATRLAAEELPAGTGGPTSDDVFLSITNLNGTKPVPAASGRLALDDVSQGWPHGKLVPIIHVPARPVTTDVYTTP